MQGGQVHSHKHTNTHTKHLIKKQECFLCYCMCKNKPIFSFRLQSSRVLQERNEGDKGGVGWRLKTDWTSAGLDPQWGHWQPFKTSDPLWGYRGRKRVGPWHSHRYGWTGGTSSFHPLKGKTNSLLEDRLTPFLLILYSVHPGDIWVSFWAAKTISIQPLECIETQRHLVGKYRLKYAKLSL